MRAVRVAHCSVVAWALIAGCRPAPEPSRSAITAVALPEPPPPPEHGLPTVPFPAQWAPPRAVAGDLDALAEALGSATDVVVVAQPRLVDGDTRLRAALQQLKPEASWAVQAGPWDAAVASGTLPLTRITRSSGVPSYEASGVRAARTSSKTVLAIADAPIDLGAWRALPAAWSGSCEPAFEALALSQEQSLAYAEPFLDHVDAVLRLHFRAGLARTLPELREQVAPYASKDPPAEASAAEVDTYACGHAQYLRVEAAATCIEGSVCSVGPRIVLRGGAAVAMPAPAWNSPECASTRVEDTLQALATEASESTVAELEPQWVTLADRIGAMGAVYEALEDLCSPRRRRFSDEDVEDARVRLARVPRALGSQTLDEAGRWSVGTAPLFVPGTGPMLSLAQFVPAPGGASQTAVAEAKGVRRFLLSRSLCRSGYGELPLAVAVFEPGSAEASYFGYVYEEALLCADLPVALSPPVSPER